MHAQCIVDLAVTFNALSMHCSNFLEVRFQCIVDIPKNINALKHQICAVTNNAFQLLKQCIVAQNSTLSMHCPFSSGRAVFTFLFFPSFDPEELEFTGGTTFGVGIPEELEFTGGTTFGVGVPVGKPCVTLVSLV